MKKILKYFAIIFILLIGVLVSAPFLFKNQIMELVRNTANKHLTADVDFRDVGISLIRNFPDLTLDVYDFSITGRDTFADVTLLHVEDFRFTLNLMSVIKGDQIDIKTIALFRPYVHIVALDSLLVNYDIMVPDETTDDASIEPETTEESAFSLSLRRFSIRDMAFKYEDHESNIYVEMEGLNHVLSGNFTQDDVDISTETNINRLRFILDGITMLADVEAKADVDLKFNQPSFSIDIQEGSYAMLNALRLDLFGNITMPEEIIDLDLTFGTPSSELKPLISLIPAYYMADFEGLDVSGVFDFGGNIKGIYDGENEIYPSMDIKLKAKNGRIKYPDLPSEISNLMINASVQHPGGDLDKLKLDVYQFAMNMAGQTINASFALATPMSDPAVSLNAKGKLVFDDLIKVVPLEETMDIKGIANLDVKFSARMSDVEHERYDNIIAYGEGELSDFKYTDSDMPYPVEIPHAYMVLKPEMVNVESFKLKLGSTDIQATGRLDNLIHYVMSDVELQGRFNVVSNTLNIDELMLFMQEEDPENAKVVATEDGEVEVLTVEDIRLPEHVDFAMTARVDNIVYDNMDIKNLSGEVHLKDQTLRMNQTQMELMGGRLVMDGSFDTKEEKPKASFAMDLSNIPFANAYNTLDMVKQLAPIMENAEGVFSTRFSMNTLINQDLSIDLNSLTAEGMLRTAGVVLRTEVLDKIADFLRNDEYRKLSLSNTLAEFEINDGRLYLKPTDLKAKQLKGTVEGSSGLDQTLDFTMDLEVPFKSVRADKLLSQIGSKTPSNVEVQVLIGGTYSAPTVKTSLGSLGKGLIDDVKSQVKDRVKEEVDDAVEKTRQRARDEADKLLKDAQERADRVVAEAERQAERVRQGGKETGARLRKEAKEQGDRLIAEAGNNLLKKRAAEEAASRLRREADRNASRVEQEADDRANQIVERAQKEADGIMNEAQSNRDKLD
ncbi:MAG: AsmA family protein [Cryomorphaceae bacterium]|nr:AsmA family protein [Cryomorphaceae bacterium]